MEQNHRFGQIVNILLGVILIAAIALTVYAINQVRSINSEAKGKPTTTTTSACARENTTGSLAVAESKSYTMSTCSATTFLSGWVSWDKSFRDSTKDISVLVTSPTGQDFVFNDGPSAAQTFIMFGPIEQGAWTIKLTNVGTSNIPKYDINMGIFEM